MSKKAMIFLTERTVSGFILQHAQFFNRLLHITGWHFYTAEIQFFNRGLRHVGIFRLSRFSFSIANFVTSAFLDCRDSVFQSRTTSGRHFQTAAIQFFNRGLRHVVDKWNVRSLEPNFRFP